jgi:hypothetical protein
MLAIGKTWPKCGRPARTPKPFLVFVSPMRMSVKFSMPMDAGALVIVIPTVRTVEEGKPEETGLISHHSANEARVAGLRSRPLSGATFRVVIAIPSTTT